MSKWGGMMTLRVSCGVLLLLLAGTALAQTGERVALVIGNSDYQHERLANPGNDAQDMAQTLRALGFTVILKENLDRRELAQALSEFAQTLRRGSSVGLFYYAGHGVEVGGVNYMLPVQAQIDSEADVEFEAIDVQRVLRQMEEAGNQANILIIDACRNNPFGRSFGRNSASRGLARMNAPVGSIVASSTAPGAVAADGAYGRNSPYTKHLLRLILQPLDIEQLFKEVRKAVLAETQGKQVPWEASSLIADFYFVTGDAPPPPSPSLPPLPEDDAPRIDPAVVGLWELQVPNAQGVARWVLEIRPDQTYHFTSDGPGAAPTHDGAFTAARGHWTLTSQTIDWSDAGTYQVPEPDALVMTGKLGTGYWRRAGSTAAGGCAEIVGDWSWSTGGIVSFSADQRASWRQTETAPSAVFASWRCAAAVYTITWSHGFTDTLRLSADGSQLSGTNNVKLPVSGRRLTR
jgi:hypothetical protein